MKSEIRQEGAVLNRIILLGGELKYVYSHYLL